MNENLNISPSVTNITCIEAWHNGTEWYRIYSDGFIEQGGVTIPQNYGNHTTITVNFHKPYTQKPNVIATKKDGNVYWAAYNYLCAPDYLLTTTSFGIITYVADTTIGNNVADKLTFTWRASGY